MTYGVLSTNQEWLPRRTENSAGSPASRRFSYGNFRPKVGPQTIKHPHNCNTVKKGAGDPCSVQGRKTAKLHVVPALVGPNDKIPPKDPTKNCEPSVLDVRILVCTMTGIVNRRIQLPNHPHQERSIMLVLSRKFNESIVIDGGIKITVLEICCNRIRLGIEAPKEVGIMREELVLATTNEMVAVAV